ncbi:MAG: hypothetical protein JW896_15265 [Deltaproteobacteria bacterium]|nr:hypothetical protein [Deltaproteobacteria bacterium]
MSSLNHVLRLISVGIIIILLSACFQKSSLVDTGFTDSMLTELREMKGEYLWNDELKRYIYSEKNLIEKILSTIEPELAVNVLVNCLDDLSLTNSTLRGKRLVTGVICYEALSQTVYYEPTTQEGDIAKKWPGHILPTATPDELSEAKRAWKKVIDSKSYILL